MTKNLVLVIFGVIAIVFIAFGAYRLGKNLTEREGKSIDQEIELLKRHQGVATPAERFALLRAYGKSRRAALDLTFSSAGNCEPLLEAAEIFMQQAGETAHRTVSGALATTLADLNPQDREEFTSYLETATTLADHYDDCLGNR